MFEYLNDPKIIETSCRDLISKIDDRDLNWREFQDWFPPLKIKHQKQLTMNEGDSTVSPDIKSMSLKISRGELPKQEMEKAYRRFGALLITQLNIDEYLVYSAPMTGDLRTAANRVACIGEVLGIDPESLWRYANSGNRRWYPEAMNFIGEVQAKAMDIKPPFSPSSKNHHEDIVLSILELNNLIKAISVSAAELSQQQSAARRLALGSLAYAIHLPATRLIDEKSKVSHGNDNQGWTQSFFNQCRELRRVWAQIEWSVHRFDEIRMWLYHQTINDQTIFQYMSDPRAKQIEFLMLLQKIESSLILSGTDQDVGELFRRSLDEKWPKLWAQLQQWYDLFGIANELRKSEISQQPKRRKDEKERRAIAIKIEHPEWSHEQIAKEVGMTPRNLKRYESYMTVCRRYATSPEPPKGFRLADGDIEAVSNN